MMTATSPQMEALHARYARSFASKHEALVEAWRAFAAAPDEVAARTLHGLVHRLAGSAPTYGYASLGLLARKADYAFADGGRDLAARLKEPIEALLDELSHLAERAKTGPSDTRV
jgi:HPt (histidine-containing phosphotransfer) domain-containing protein